MGTAPDAGRKDNKITHGEWEPPVRGRLLFFLYASHKKGRQTGTPLYLTCKSGIYAVLKLYFGAEPRGYLWGCGVFSGWMRCPEHVFCFLWLF